MKEVESVQHAFPTFSPTHFYIAQTLIFILKSPKLYLYFRVKRMMSSGINALIVSKSKGNVVEIKGKRCDMLPPSVIFVSTDYYILPYVLLLSLVQFISILWHCISMAIKSR